MPRSTKTLRMVRVAQKKLADRLSPISQLVWVGGEIKNLRLGVVNTRLQRLVEGTGPLHKDKLIFL